MNDMPNDAAKPVLIFADSRGGQHRFIELHKGSHSGNIIDSFQWDITIMPMTLAFIWETSQWLLKLRGK